MNTVDYDVVVLTEDRYAFPVNISDYVKNVLVEDALLVNALSNLGLRTARFSWSDKNVDWNSVRSVVFRTTWDYFDRYHEFKPWFDEMKRNVIMYNEASILEWNQDKIYLKEMQEKGIPIPETIFIKMGECRHLMDIISDLSTEEFILKPNISGAARLTFRLNKKGCVEFEKRFRELIDQEDFIVQAFQEQIMTKGEISLILIKGEYTHAVLKKGKPGDFRVQDDFGGTVHEYEANEEEINFATECYRALEIKPFYCRVDLIWDNDNRLVLSELEMIEPELWFRRCPEAALKLANAIHQDLSKR